MMMYYIWYRRGKNASISYHVFYFMEYWYWFGSNGAILGSILDVLGSVYCSKNGSDTKGVPIGIESIFFGDLDGKQVSGCPINPIKIQIFTYPPHIIVCLGKNNRLLVLIIIFIVTNKIDKGGGSKRFFWCDAMRCENIEKERIFIF